MLALPGPGDGVSNLIELLTGHYPSELDDKPTAAKIAGSRKFLADFRKHQRGYPWMPFEPVQRPPGPTPSPRPLAHQGSGEAREVRATSSSIIPSMPLSPLSMKPLA